MDTKNHRPWNAVAETATQHVAVAVAVAVAVSVAVCSKTATSETLYEILQVDLNILILSNIVGVLCLSEH